MIRSPKVEEAIEIAEVHVLSWQKAYRDLLPDDYLSSLSIENRKEMWEKAINTFPENTIVYEQNRKIIGFSNYGNSRDEDALQETGEIRAIYILEQYWSNGIGSQLLQSSLTKLEKLGYKLVSLWVLDTNQRAIKFYQKAGFDFDGKNKLEKRNDTSLHEVRMVKTIHS